MKWFRLYLDFCDKYPLPEDLSPLFRHHLLQANYDIRTIRKLLGHASLKTTMIYTCCVPVRTVLEVKSPLDI